jgi:hypothetical protein
MDAGANVRGIGPRSLAYIPHGQPSPSADAGRLARTLAALRRLHCLAPEATAEARALCDVWLDLARWTPATPWQGGPLDLVRYSGRQRAEAELRGVAGHLRLPEGPGPLADLLAAAAWLHLGKGTVMGLGRVRRGGVLTPGLPGPASP